MNEQTTISPLLGCLLGTAVGDAIGLPAEGLSRAKAERYCRGGLRHGLIWGRGMFSDDTEHTLMVVVALGKAGDALAFQRRLGWSLRWWMLALPAGVGLSTAKAIVRLWLGFPVSRSGVGSAGNGAAMRSAVVGVMFREDQARRREFARAACRVTHTDGRAEESAQLVAEAAALAAHHVPLKAVLDGLRPLLRSREMLEHWAKLESGLERVVSVAEFAGEIGCGKGVRGFAPDTVAVALFAWLRHRGDYGLLIREVVACGGDTDTVAAIAGGICGAETGEAGIPVEWVTGICDWPRSVGYIRKLAAALEDPAVNPMPTLNWPLIPVRNLVFLLVVLGHGFRRCWPVSK